ncbi:peptidase [Methanolobus zinderi]|jgi:hypothetical protein|uniref:Peptidase n=1 Tax=Methanolobus zinderi TaxID=536044 RepID=A0A7D5E589_9EURY|nr:peptidase [Methanolobus zinderi]QLC48793.1 peptidase [Methanolobus zinderi]
MGLMSEYIKKNKPIEELNSELRELIKKYNQKKDTYMVVHASAISKSDIPDVALNMDDYYAIIDLIRDVESTNLDFYIETPGGSGEAAEEIVRHLRNKFENINFVVSGEAKSAGTIIVLSGNEIYMTETGSLGPIDAQVFIGRYRVSAHDYIEWVNEKWKEAESKGRLNPFDATMIAQISPGELRGVEHSLRFAEEIVGKWLAKYKFSKWNVTETHQRPVTTDMKIKRAKEVASELINHGKWRSHGRSLKINDLEDIGLKINRVDSDLELADIVYRIQTIIRLIFSNSNTYKIFVTQDNILSKNATVASPVMPINEAMPEAVEAKIECEGCKKIHELYINLNGNKEVDQELKSKGLIPFPNNSRLICECGTENDLSGLKNDIESKFGKKIVN